MKKKQLLSALALSFLSFSVSAQLTVNSGMTPDQYVQNVLIGSGVTVSNVTFTGQSLQIGAFSGMANNMPFAGGVALSSGSVSSIVGPAFNDPGGAANQFYTYGGSTLQDTMLLHIAQSVTANPDAPFIIQTHDPAVLEFDFVPSSTVVSFNFVFGSDEYLTWVNSSYNDAFGFFVSGPGIYGNHYSPPGFSNGSVNLATVPGTSLPITVSTIYPGMNAQYYLDNSGDNNLSLNGVTMPTPVSFNVFCDSVYHFKFAVTDCSDDYLNTVVFLEQNSFNATARQYSVSLSADETTFTCDSISGATYQWILCPENVPISGATSCTYTSTLTESVAVIVTIGSCSDTSACVNNNGLGIEEQGHVATSLSVAPNPSKSYILVKYIPDQELVIMDAFGQPVMKIKTTTSGEVNVDIQQLSYGVYYLTTPDHSEQIKILHR